MSKAVHISDKATAQKHRRDLRRKVRERARALIDLVESLVPLAPSSRSASAMKCIRSGLTRVWREESLVLQEKTLDRLFLEAPHLLTIALLNIRDFGAPQVNWWQFLNLLARTIPDAPTPTPAVFIFRGSRLGDWNATSLVPKAIQDFQTIWATDCSFSFEGSLEEYAEFLQWGHHYKATDLQIRTRGQSTTEKASQAYALWMINLQKALLDIYRRHSEPGLKEGPFWIAEWQVLPADLEGCLASLGLNLVRSCLKEVPAMTFEGNPAKALKRRYVVHPCFHCGRWVRKKAHILTCDNIACRNKLRDLRDPLAQQRANENHKRKVRGQDKYSVDEYARRRERGPKPSRYYRVELSRGVLQPLHRMSVRVLKQPVPQV